MKGKTRTSAAKASEPLTWLRSGPAKLPQFNQIVAGVEHKTAIEEMLHHHTVALIQRDISFPPPPPTRQKRRRNSGLDLERRVFAENLTKPPPSLTRTQHLALGFHSGVTHCHAVSVISTSDSEIPSLTFSPLAHPKLLRCTNV